MKKLLIILMIVVSGICQDSTKSENKVEPLGWANIGVKWGANPTIDYPIIVPNYKQRINSVKLIGFTHVYEDTVFVISTEGDTLKVKQ